MAVIISNGNTTLATASGFYRVETYNLAGFSTTRLLLTTTRTISVTFANAGNCQGLILGLNPNTIGADANTYRDVTVKLQEDVVGVWTDRATKTLTGDEMYNSSTVVGLLSGTPCVWIVPFIFGTPYAVTTAGSTWRFEISLAASAGSVTNTTSIQTSDATNPFYASWCDNAVSFASNDVVIAKNNVVIDMTATFKGILGTGDTTRSVCAIACKNTDPTVANVAQFIWENPAAASYTLTIDGLFILSAHAGFRAGTSASRISTANKAIIDVIAATSGTNTNTGFNQMGLSDGNRNSKSSFFAYGEIPTYEDTTLPYPVTAGGTVTVTIASPCVGTKSGMINGMVFNITTTGALPTGLTASTNYFAGNVSGSTFNIYDTYANAIAGGATGRVDTSGSQSGTHTMNSTIITAVSTGWSIGDGVWIGKQITKGGSDATFRTISAISGTSITLSSNLSGGGRAIDAPIFRFGYYGVKINHPSGLAVNMNMPAPSNFVMSGVELYDLTGIALQITGTAISFDDSANRSQLVLEHCSGRPRSIASSSFLTAVIVPQDGVLIDHCNMVGQLPCVTTSLLSSYSGVTTWSNNISCNPSQRVTIDAGLQWTVDANKFFDQNNLAWTVAYNGVSVTHTDNEYWGFSNSTATNASCRIDALINTVDWSGNKYDNNTGGLRLGGSTNTIITRNDIFGSNTANTTDVTMDGSIYMDVEINSPTGNLTILTTNLSATFSGSILKFSDFNDTTNDDKGYLPEGYYQRTGSGLTDTTCRTAGGFAIRLQPISGTVPLTWPNRVVGRIIPTGDIQNKTMTVTGWIYINNTAYDAGTYVLPSMNVKYDNATTVTATTTATFGSWQQVALNFTPTTTYGQIELWFSGATDATSTNAYFYIDDINVAYPAGVIVNNGPLDKWANALPVWPPTSSIGNQTNFWDELKTNHTVSGSFGLSVAETEVEAKNFLAGDKMEGA